MDRIDGKFSPHGNAASVESSHRFLNEVYAHKPTLGDASGIVKSATIQRDSSKTSADVGDSKDKQPAPSADGKKSFNVDEVKSLVSNLGDDDFKTREAAEQTLKTKLYGTGHAGVDVLKQLRQNEKDPETRRRLDLVIAKLHSHPDVFPDVRKKTILGEIEEAIANLEPDDRQIYRDFASALLDGDAAKVTQLFSWQPTLINDKSRGYQEISKILLAEMGMTLEIVTSDNRVAAQATVRDFTNELRIGFTGEPMRICIDAEESCKPSNIAFDVYGREIKNVNPSEVFRTLMEGRFKGHKFPIQISRRERDKATN